MIKRPNTKAQRVRRHQRVRGKVSGTAERPRLSVFRSENNIYAQIIDDVAGKTLCSASTVEKGFEGNGGNCEAAAKIGKLGGELARRVQRPFAARIVAVYYLNAQSPALCLVLGGGGVAGHDRKRRRSFPCGGEKLYCHCYEHQRACRAENSSRPPSLKQLVDGGNYYVGHAERKPCRRFYQFH